MKPYSKVNFLLFFTFMFAFQVKAQSIYSTFSMKLDSSAFFSDSAVVYVNNSFPLVWKKDSVQDVSVIYEMQYVRSSKSVSEENRSEEVKILRLYSNNTAKVVKLKLVGEKQHKSEMDVSEFYSILIKRIENLDFSFYKQELPGLAPPTLSERNYSAWFLLKNSSIQSAIVAFDLPSITFSANDINFPGKVWQPLVSLDIYQMIKE